MSIWQKEVVLPVFPRGYHLIDHILQEHLVDVPKFGLLHLFLKHSSAALSINENADPSVRFDLERSIDLLVPENQKHFTHTYEGSDDMPAHIKCSLLGASLQIPITNGAPNLGTWQGIYLCEFRNNAKARTLVLSIVY
ncbi:MAG: YjbQ family protein [Chitinophagales bacterium]|nr:YjbQ family protein [Chitinophagales bacterium]